MLLLLFEHTICESNLSVILYMLSQSVDQILPYSAHTMCMCV